MKFDKKFVMSNLPLLIFAWIGNKAYYAYRISNGDTTKMLDNFNAMFSNPIPSFYKSDIIAGIVTAVAVKIFLYIKKQTVKSQIRPK